MEILIFYYNIFIFILIYNKVYLFSGLRLAQMNQTKFHEEKFSILSLFHRSSWLIIIDWTDNYIKAFATHSFTSVICCLPSMMMPAVHSVYHDSWLSSRQQKHPLSPSNSISLSLCMSECLICSEMKKSKAGGWWWRGAVSSLCSVLIKHTL